jgi:hypothetical protein
MQNDLKVIQELIVSLQPLAEDELMEYDAIANIVIEFMYVCMTVSDYWNKDGLIRINYSLMAK